jgi:hypothetical protein
MTDLGAFENEEIVVDDVNRDGYGFALRPQHIQRYREYANIYKVWQTHTHTHTHTHIYMLSSCFLFKCFFSSYFAEFVSPSIVEC